MFQTGTILAHYRQRLYQNKKRKKLTKPGQRNEFRVKGAGNKKDTFLLYYKKNSIKKIEYERWLVVVVYRKKEKYSVKKKIRFKYFLLEYMLITTRYITSIDCSYITFFIRSFIFQASFIR